MFSLPYYRTAHQRAHENQNLNKKIKWPWENIANKSMENFMTNNESVDLKQSVDKSFQQHQKKSKIKETDRKRRINLQKFSFDKNTGYLYCTDNPSLVFGVETSEGNVNQVILMRKNENDPNQRWTLKENIISLKSRPHLVLTVQYNPFDVIMKNLNIDLETDECIMKLKDIESLESFLTEAAPEIFSKSLVTLQRYVKTQTGGSNQKWYFEEKTGFIYAFRAQEIDLSLYN